MKSASLFSAEYQKRARAGIWVENGDVLGPDDLCYRAITTTLSPIRSADSGVHGAIAMAFD
jgi:hypothetical protein